MVCLLTAAQADLGTLGIGLPSVTENLTKEHFEGALHHGKSTCTMANGGTRRFDRTFVDLRIPPLNRDLRHNARQGMPLNIVHTP